VHVALFVLQVYACTLSLECTKNQKNSALSVEKKRKSNSQLGMEHEAHHLNREKLT
jgi:hypothetical protein